MSSRPNFDFRFQSLTRTKQLKHGRFLGFMALIDSHINVVESLVHGPAVSLILIGRNHFVHIGPDRGQDAVQLLHGLLGQGGLSAQDPGQLGAEGAQLLAAVDQSVAVVVCGQHPVGTRGRGCGRDQRFKETSSLAGSEGSSASAEPTMENNASIVAKSLIHPSF